MQTTNKTDNIFKFLPAITIVREGINLKLERLNLAKPSTVASATIVIFEFLIQFIESFLLSPDLVQPVVPEKMSTWGEIFLKFQSYLYFHNKLNKENQNKFFIINDHISINLAIHCNVKN